MLLSIWVTKSIPGMRSHSLLKELGQKTEEIFETQYQSQPTLLPGELKYHKFLHLQYHLHLKQQCHLNPCSLHLDLHLDQLHSNSKYHIYLQFNIQLHFNSQLHFNNQVI